MNQVIFSFLIILSFSIGGFLGFLAGNGSLVVKLDLAAWVGAIGSITAAAIACIALNSWREQKALDCKKTLLGYIRDLDSFIEQFSGISMRPVVDLRNASNNLSEITKNMEYEILSLGLYQNQNEIKNTSDNLRKVVLSISDNVSIIEFLEESIKTQFNLEFSSNIIKRRTLIFQQYELLNSSYKELRNRIVN